MKRLWMSGAAAMMAMTFASVNAQTPQTQNPQTQPPTQTQRPAQSMDNQATQTVTGCVYKEADVPGRSPNVAERAGILEDYILVASTDTSATGTTGTTPPAGTAGTTGSKAMKHKAFKLEHADDDKLQALVGKRVQVTGKVDAEAGDSRTGAATGTTGAPRTDRSVGPDQIELPEFEVTSIREVEGTCPATPDIKK